MGEQMQVVTLSSGQWSLLTYLYTARQAGATVIAMPECSQGTDVLRLKPHKELGGAFAELGSYVFDPAEVDALESEERYITLSRPQPGSPPRVSLTREGERVAQLSAGANHSNWMPSLTDEQRRLLQTVYDHFREHAEWPKYWKIGRRLVPLNVPQVANSLPPGFLNAHAAGDALSSPRVNGDSAVLYVPAIRFCEGSNEDLGNFMRVLRLCLDRFLDQDVDEPQVSASDLREELHLDDPAVRKMHALISSEPGITWSGGSSGDSDWYVGILSGISRYLEVESIDEYILASRALRRTVGSTQQPRNGHAQLPSAVPAQAVTWPLDVLVRDEELQRRCGDLLRAERDYDRVVREACVVLEHRVRERAGKGKDLVGADLMQTVFSPKDPLLRLSDMEEEQRGAMFLYAGVMKFYRNSAGHNIIGTVGELDALQVVGFVDALLGLLEKRVSGSAAGGEEGANG